jgi:hypothetical protein
MKKFYLHIFTALAPNAKYFALYIKLYNNVQLAVNNCKGGQRETEKCYYYGLHFIVP